jgi:muramoyltetrapeptide carboxypeptidase LdcA involved in peptidoglycan recycling
VTGLSVFTEFLRTFPGPVIAGFATGHAVTPLITVPLGVLTRVIAVGQPALVLEEAAASA